MSATTRTLQRLYKMQATGEISFEAVALWNWLRWEGHPNVSGSYALIASRFSPKTKAGQVKHWMGTLVKLGILKRVSKKGASVPVWRVGNFEETQETGSKSTSKPGHSKPKQTTEQKSTASADCAVPF